MSKQKTYKKKGGFFANITKAQRKHLRESGIRTVADFKDVREHQRKRAREGDYFATCYECSQIASRVGFE